MGGLRIGDIIIEINGANVTRENHTQVVERIKASGDTTVFLVADNECKEYHDREDKLICSSLPYVIHLSSSRSGDQMREHSDDEEKVAEKDPSPVPPTASSPKPLDNSSSSSSYSSQHEGEVVAPIRSAPPVMASKRVSVAASSSEEEMSLGLRGVRVVTDYHSPQEERRDLFAQHEQVPQHPHDESLLLGQNGPLNQPAVLPNFFKGLNLRNLLILSLVLVILIGLQLVGLGGLLLGRLLLIGLCLRTHFERYLIFSQLKRIR